MQQIQINYDLHPAFKADSPSWRLGEGAAADFAALFDFLKNSARVLPEHAQQDLARRCHESLAAVFGSLSEQAIESRHKLFLADLHRHADRLLRDDIKYFCRPIDRRGLSPSNNGQQFPQVLSLAGAKYYTGQLDPRVVAEMLAIAQPALATFRRAAAEGRTTRSDLSVNSGPVVQRLMAILNREFERMGINSSVSMYMAQRMHVGGLALELSVPTATWWRSGYEDLPREPKTVYFHVDEGRANPKSIVYLTDVTTQTGPTSAAPYALDKVELTPLQLLVGRIIGNVGRKTDSELERQYKHTYHQIFGCPVFRSDFMKLPSEMRWNSHFGWDVVPDSDLEELLVRSEKKVTGPAGTFLIFDGFNLLHRGGLVQSGERVALQVIFAPKPKRTPRTQVRSVLRAAAARLQQARKR